MYQNVKLDGRTIFAFGDVHGCLKPLQSAVEFCREKALKDGAPSTFIFLGDYIDRGPDSCGTLNFLMSLSEEEDILLLKGNHDDMLAKAWRDPGCVEANKWWEHGGQRTLMSYGWDPLSDPVPGELSELVPEDHIKFIERMPLIIESERHIFVHAGLRPAVGLSQQIEHDLLWIRGDFLKSEHWFGKPVVHGHSPVKSLPEDLGWRINLDTGCFYSGRLTMAEFDQETTSPVLRTFSERGCEPSVEHPVKPRSP